MAKGDKPRLVVVCSYEDYPAIQKGVTSLGHEDVLVNPSKFVDAGMSYIIDPLCLEPEPWPV